MTAAPSPFSSTVPKLQVAWDSTSLRALQFCPRYYQYSILDGWGGSSVDLEFGILAHGAVEAFYRARLAGDSRDEAQIKAVRWALENSGEHAGGDGETVCDIWQPWGGMYSDAWRCLGETPYKNAKGNRAKCPYSHKGAWSHSAQPPVCGECGSNTEGARVWVANDKVKDRYALVRLVVWYIEEQPEALEEGIQPLKLKDGTDAIELSFKLPLPFQTNIGGETAYLLCGYFDRLGKFGSEHLVVDLKTSRHALSKRYFAGFSPHTQVDNYDLAASMLFPDMHITGVMIDGAQLMVNGVRFGKHIEYRSEARRAETLADVEYWIRQAEKYAAEDHWPMNRANCWNCGFNSICSLDPAIREAHLEANFTRRRWNPLEER